MSAPVLSYALQTNPTTVSASQAGKPVSEATLKLAVSNPTSKYVNISKIVFTLPSEGTNAKNLSNNQSNIPTSSATEGWSIHQSGSSFVITPDNTAAGTQAPYKLGGQGLVFTFGPIPINETPGTVQITVVEDIGQNDSSELPFEVSKWPAEFSLSPLTAIPVSVTPGHSTSLSWEMTGDATLELDYNGQRIQNPTSPYATPGLATTTVFTLIATSHVNGNPVEVHRQATIPVNVPSVVSFGPLFDIVYSGQANTLFWSTQEADHCVLKANGVILDSNAPASTPATGYSVTSEQLESTTSFELDPMDGRTGGMPERWSTFAKTLKLRMPFPGQSGWGAVAVDYSGAIAYICNSHTNKLDVINLKTGAVEKSIPVGMGPRGVSVAQQGSVVLVSNAYEDSVSIVDLTSGTVTGTVANVPSPAGIAVIGNTAYVASASSSKPAVITIDIEARTVGKTSPVLGRPSDVAITPDGAQLYVTNGDASSIDVYDVATMQKSASIALSTQPSSVAASGNGASMYTGGRLGNELTVINAHVSPPEITAQVSASNPTGIGVSGSGQWVAVVGLGNLLVYELSLPLIASAMAEEEDTATY